MIKKIILSRLKKTKEEEFVKQRREICRVCEYNSLNREKIPLNKLILKKLSDFYSLITGNLEVDVLGNCTACESCSIYYKSLDEEHCPHPNEDKWVSIFIPNSAKKNLKTEK